METTVRIEDLRDEILRIAEIHGASNVRVFGSVARGQATAASDLDILVDMGQERTFLDLIALADELEAQLGIRVDVVTESGLSPYFKDEILAQAVAL